jgi:hypothetical protein
MKKSLAAAMAALTFGGAIAATAAPAEARDWGHGHRGYYGGGGWDHRYGNGDAALAAGVLGLAVGAALADSGGRGYYGPAYYDRGGYYGYERPYRICESRHWRWDPYIGRNVLVTSRYAC